MTRQELIENLPEILGDRNLSDISRQTWITRETIYSSFIKGKYSPRLCIFEKILDALGYEIDIIPKRKKENQD